jgi:hypothetical protein
MLKYKIVRNPEEIKDGVVLLDDKEVLYIQNFSSIFRRYNIFDCVKDRIESSIFTRIKYLIKVYFEVVIFNENYQSIEIPTYNFIPPILRINNESFRYKSINRKESVIYKNDEIVLRKINPFREAFYMDYRYYTLYVKEGEDIIFLLSMLLCLDFDFEEGNN